MSSMLFYQNIVPLNDQRHADLRLSAHRDYGFTARSHSVPILAGEFAECARSYPIIFSAAKTGVVPLVLLGLREHENLFVDAAGRWQVSYVPAFVRRYPFVAGTGEEGQMVVCIDDKATCLAGTAGEPLFAQGEPTARLQKSMAFLREFQAAALATAAMASRIEELGLLREADSLAQLNNGKQFRLSGMRVVDEQRLQALDDALVLELFRSGTLRLIHMHLMSLGNLSGLIERLATFAEPARKNSAKTEVMQEVM